MNFKKWVKSIQTAGYNGAYGSYDQVQNRFDLDMVKNGKI